MSFLKKLFGSKESVETETQSTFGNSSDEKWRKSLELLIENQPNALAQCCDILGYWPLAWMRIRPQQGLYRGNLRIDGLQAYLNERPNPLQPIILLGELVGLIENETSLESITDRQWAFLVGIRDLYVLCEVSPKIENKFVEMACSGKGPQKLIPGFVLTLTETERGPNEVRMKFDHPERGRVFLGKAFEWARVNGILDQGRSNK